MAFSFATTYALGQVAKRYYAGGRVMSTAMLRESFQDMLGPAKQLQTEYLPQIRQRPPRWMRGKSCRWCEAPEPSPTRAPLPRMRKLPH